MAKSLDGMFFLSFPSLFIYSIFNNYIYSFANFIYYQCILLTNFFIHPSHPLLVGSQEGATPLPHAGSRGPGSAPTAAILGPSSCLGRGRRAA